MIIIIIIITCTRGADEGDRKLVGCVNICKMCTRNYDFFLRSLHFVFFHAVDSSLHLLLWILVVLSETKDGKHHTRVSEETYHFFRVTLTEIHCIKIDNLKIQLSSLNNSNPHQARLPVSNFRKMQWSCREALLKVTETAHGTPQTKCCPLWKCNQYDLWLM